MIMGTSAGAFGSLLFCSRYAFLITAINAVSNPVFSLADVSRTVICWPLNLASASCKLTCLSAPKSDLQPTTAMAMWPSSEYCLTSCNHMDTLSSVSFAVTS
eukprot:Mycagemm_TRINITY_DN2505_c0_g1::TRINITY_DN2505_c0_g1_i1::g.4575::m.4575 type:complete len:102 gc:universal TRINITY_DN2505_c0_g1_i1:674-369(-)